MNILSAGHKLLLLLAFLLLHQPLLNAAQQTLELVMGELGSDVYVAWAGSVDISPFTGGLPGIDVTLTMSKGDGTQWLAFPQTSYIRFDSTSGSLFDVTYFNNQPGQWWIFPLTPEDATGENVGISYGPHGNNGAIYLPLGYQSGSPIAGCIIHRDSTFQSLGLIPNTNTPGHVIDAQQVMAQWRVSGNLQQIVFRTQQNAFVDVPQSCLPLVTATTTTTTTSTTTTTTTTSTHTTSKTENSSSDSSLDSESD